MNILLGLLVVVDCVSVTLQQNVAELTATSTVNPVTPLDVECSEIPEISDLTISPGNFDVFLQWKPPEDITCVQEYIVRLDNNTYNTLSNKLEISDLNACQQYEVAIAISDGTNLGQFVIKSFNTSTLASFSNVSVTNLQCAAHETDLLVTWEPPPPNIMKCVTSYYLTWWDENDPKGTNGDGKIDAPDTNITISIIGCMKYSIMVYPKHDEDMNGESVTISYQDKGLVTSAPEAIRITPYRTNATVVWETDKKSENKCKLEQIVAICNAPDNVNGDYPWIIQKQQSILNITNIETADYRYSMSITDLSPFTNYSCLGLVTNEIGNSSTKEIFFTTLEDVASEPENITVDDIHSYSFNIHWTDPKIIPGIITSYGIVIRNEGPNYPLDKDLVVKTGLDTIVDADQNSLNYTEAQPYYNYTISVFAIDGAGNGSENSVQITTMEGVTSEPDSIAIDKGSYHFVIHWTEPKIVPGIITSYRIIIRNEGPNYPLDDELIDKTGLNTTVDADQKSLNFTKAQPYYNYTVSVFAIDGAGSGPENSVQITTLEGVISEPDSITIDKGSYHFVINWTDPKIVPGIISSYGIIIRNEGPNYPLDEDLVVETNFENTVGPDRKTLNYTEAQPYYNYKISVFAINGAGNGSEQSMQITTLEGVSSELLNITTDEGSYHFIIHWADPKITAGIITSYGLLIRNEGPNYQFNESCMSFIGINNETIIVPASEKSHNFTKAVPYSMYTVTAFAINGAGDGNQTSVPILTKAAEPDEVTDPQVQPPVYSAEETYSATSTLQFEPSCDTRGPLVTYQIRITGRRDGFHDDYKPVNTTATALNMTLLPERVYSFEVVVVTEEFTSLGWTTSLQTRPGVPTLVIQPEVPWSNVSTEAYFKMSKKMFSNLNGEVLYYALILLPKSDDLNETYGFWDNTTDTWPSPPADNGGSFAPYQLTPDLWNPFKDGSEEIDFVIGEDDNCREPCNKPLIEETEYSLIVRALTSATYKDGPLLHFVTAQPEILDRLNWGLILGLTFGLLALLTLVIFIIYLWRRKKKIFIKEEEFRVSETLPTAVPNTKYLDYYNNIKENYNVLKLQFTELNTLSKEVASPISYAILPENRRKNRYTNILPYDQTRVKLKLDDDEITTDYINASYIKGYSSKIEYIATQGPLEHTSLDFWSMILQENVTVIVMVSQFIEQSKEKCYRYFPKNHEQVSFGESLDVRCSSELHFGTYCIRSLQVRKDKEQRNVTHLQFLEWPDFGVPQSSNSMLQFCREMRDKIKAEEGLIVVHCSAGVGRTGTLIALDILLQTIDNHREINIFKTVLDLRKQRAHMVQTEKQYMFIHTCVKEYIEAPTPQSHGISEEKQEPIYENIEIIKPSTSKNLIGQENAS